MNFRGRGIDGMDFRQLQDAASAAMLARQSSIYSLTFDELHSAMGGYVKDFGSMNMDEFLKSVWTAEESQGMETALRTPDQVGLQRQGSLTLPRTLSHKTVDEVWQGLRDCGTGGSEFQQQQTALGEVTLEEFLVRAGVVREEMSRSVNTGIPSGVTANGVLYGDSMEGSGNNNTCPAPLGFLHVGRSAVGGMESSTERRLYAAPPLALGSNGDLGCSQGMRGGGVNNGVISPMNRISADGRNGDQSSLSPFPYVFNGGFSGKRANGAVEKTVERRQRRMIKNRESAARSRARKQAYTMELEAEVAQLKEENEELQKKQAEIMEMQRNQVIEMRNQQRRTKLCLRRTQTSPCSSVNILATARLIRPPSILLAFLGQGVNYGICICIIP